MTGPDARKQWLYAAREFNVLTLTSRCNVHCLFCSHRQNPPGLLTYTLSPLSPEDVRSQVDLLSPRHKIIVGESATRICEGEPFTHEQIRDILSRVRDRHPRTPLQITTNGILLQEADGPFLASLQPLELIISLNSGDPARRRVIMGESARELPAALELCRRYHIPFHGSIVALPHLTGFEDLHRTLCLLEEAGALSVRVFLPGFTRLAPPGLRFEKGLLQELAAFLSGEEAHLEIPITLEPPLLHDLAPVVKGVLRGSPAARSGIRKGDMLRFVAGQVPFSRADAFNLIKRAGSPSLTLEREGKPLQLTLAKGAGEASGLVMDFDLERRTVDLIQRGAASHAAPKVLLLASEFAYPLLKEALAPAGKGMRVRPVPNLFFGGSIGCSGLLTVDDLMRVARQELSQGDVELILVPGTAFDFTGRDLKGASYLDMAEGLGIPVMAL